MDFGPPKIIGLMKMGWFFGAGVPVDLKFLFSMPSLVLWSWIFDQAFVLVWFIDHGKRKHKPSISLKHPYPIRRLFPDGKQSFVERTPFT